jgi:oxygen-independent coproporphyrinogen-3 oxidase
MTEDLIHLLHKYDVALPRYTSYPTVPYWNFDSLTTQQWEAEVRQRFEAENREVCLYIHLPFCEELCTYCACNKRITKNHAVETPYLESVLKEWAIYKNILGKMPIIKEIHLGGGTPTFFSPQNLYALIQGISEGSQVAENHEFSIEVHPNYTTQQHLKVLAEVGFNRISLGVQDFDSQVQYIINRPQTFEQTQAVVQWARELGYESINIDLVYGLPKQTLQSIEFTIEKIKELAPDRIAFYSYAHVPWKSKGQRRYTDEDVPPANEKIAMYSLGNQLLAEQGFVAIGMDHFAMPSDKLLKAYYEKRLHRNFMGYTTTNHKLVIGLGSSSISDTWTAFAQNEKTVEAYQVQVQQGQLPIVHGHLLSKRDLVIRQHILDLMCSDSTTFDPANFDVDFLASIKNKLTLLEADRLLTLDGNTVNILPKGRLLVRHICAAFDAYLYQSKQSDQLFSKAI